MTEPNVWIVIPTWNRREDLAYCLQSIYALAYHNYQIVVVDNHSTDDTVAYVKSIAHPVHLIILDDNYGAAVAANKGFQYALEHDPDYILRLDSDTTLDPLFLSELVQAAEEMPAAGVLVGKIFYHDSPDKIWSLGAKLHYWNLGAQDLARGQVDGEAFAKRQRVDLAWATGMLIRKEALVSAGGFDESYVVYYEETDFCFQLQQLGWEIWSVPAAHMWHKIGQSAESAWTSYQWGRSKMLFYLKWGKGLHKYFLVLYAFSYAIGRAVVPKAGAGNRGPLGAALRGLIAGLRWYFSPEQGQTI